MEDIDKYATDAKHKGKIKDIVEKRTLYIVRTGSTWTRTAAYKSGKVGDGRRCKPHVKVLQVKRKNEGS